MTQSPQPPTTHESETILFETSPYRNLDAIVQHDHRTIYFYLSGQSRGDDDRFGTRACWVRNLVRGPLVIDQADMSSGSPPMLPRTDCIDPAPGTLPTADSLSIVWLEEGNGAALLEHDAETGERTPIAIIPPWSGLEGFHGYAAGCAHQTPLCWPLPDNPLLQQRIERAAEFWESMRESGEVFQKYQSSLLLALESSVGKNASSVETDDYFAIDGGQFPPRGLKRFDFVDSVALVTVGMGICPQPAVELFADNPVPLRRIELGMKIDRADIDDEADVTKAIAALAGLANRPWREWTWLGPGHAVSLSAHRVVKAELRRDESLELPGFRGDPVSLLWLG